MLHQSLLNEDQKEILKLIRDANYQTLSGHDKNGIPFLKHIFELHYKIFGETCSNCPSKIGGYIHKLKNFNPDKMELEKEKSRFELNEGVIIPVPGTSDVYSKHNLTDEDALKIIAKNPNRKALFRVLPEDLEDLLENYEEPEEGANEEGNLLITIGESKVTLEEAFSLLELINVKTKATTITGVEKKISELSDEQTKELEGLAADLASEK